MIADICLSSDEFVPFLHISKFCFLEKEMVRRQQSSRERSSSCNSSLSLRTIRGTRPGPRRGRCWTYGTETRARTGLLLAPRPRGRTNRPPQIPTNRHT